MSYCPHAFLRDPLFSLMNIQLFTEGPKNQPIGFTKKQKLLVRYNVLSKVKSRLVRANMCNGKP